MTLIITFSLLSCDYHLTSQEKVQSDPRPYIIKPNAKGEGHGIFIAETTQELDKHVLTGHVAQPLLTSPYLVQGKKFDFRSDPFYDPVCNHHEWDNQCICQIDSTVMAELVIGFSKCWC